MNTKMLVDWHMFQRMINKEQMVNIYHEIITKVCNAPLVSASSCVRHFRLSVSSITTDGRSKAAFAKK